MSNQLPQIARGIAGSETSLKIVVQELVELLQDEHSSVKLSAFDSFAELIDWFPKDIRTDRLIPLFKTFCREASEDEEEILLLSKHFGRFFFYSYGKSCFLLSLICFR
jgi:hypothetical protein